MIMIMIWLALLSAAVGALLAAATLVRNEPPASAMDEIQRARTNEIAIERARERLEVLQGGRR